VNDWDPRPDLEAAASLGDALRDAGYTEDAIVERLGDDGPAADREEVPVFSRRLAADDLGDLMRLLLLQLPVPRARIAPAEQLLELGLVVDDGGTLTPRGRIVPSEGVYLTFDGFSLGLADPPGWVASFTPTAYWLASLTPRPRVGRALDVGTGNGAHALFAARHAGHVVATDVNGRALAFTAISAALNRFENVETRAGSLFEPVAGETFDLITCNAPYVVSPESRWQYRDAGARGDAFSEAAVREAAAHLQDGGYAALTASWLAESEDDPDQRIRAWLESTGCDAWLLGLRGADPLDHAAAWTDHLVDDPGALEEAIDRWSGYLEELGAGWVSEGVVVLHKRAAARHGLRADPVEEDDLEHAGEQALRVLTGLALVADGDLARHRFRLADDAFFREELDNEGDVTEVVLALDEGTHPELEVEPEDIDVLVDPRGITVETAGAEFLRDLLELGFLDLAD
jgi:methylase of polypeptide subunit release factors